MKKRLVEGMDYVIRTADLRTAKIDGCVVSGEDGLATIVLNERVCDSRKRKALKHELDHVANDDLYSDDPIELIESRMM